MAFIQTKYTFLFWNIDFSSFETIFTLTLSNTFAIFIWIMGMLLVCLRHVHVVNKVYTYENKYF